MSERHSLCRLHRIFAVRFDLSRKTLSRRPVFHLVNGDAIELWMLKVFNGGIEGLVRREPGRSPDAQHSAKLL